MNLEDIALAQARAYSVMLRSSIELCDTRIPWSDYGLKMTTVVLYNFRDHDRVA